MQVAYFVSHASYGIIYTCTMETRVGSGGEIEISIINFITKVIYDKYRRPNFTHSRG